MSSTGPEVLLGLNQRPERVSIPTFISSKKGHTSDIRPATLPSWLKQTILPCYKQADQQALDLVQVKAHDIRAFTASKAYDGGVLVDQIMQACHGKAHNTFTNFYLKDLTWSDNNMYLGPVVAAQQVLDPSPQTSYPWKEKKGGGGGGGAHIHCNQVFRSLNQGLGICLPLQDVWVRSFYLSIYILLCIKDFLRLSLISF